MIPMLMWMLVAIYNNFTGIQTLLASGHDREYSGCFQVGVVITIALNFILVYFFKGNGACMAPLLSELALGIMLNWKVKKLESMERKQSAS